MAMVNPGGCPNDNFLTAKLLPLAKSLASLLQVECGRMETLPLPARNTRRHIRGGGLKKTYGAILSAVHLRAEITPSFNESHAFWELALTLSQVVSVESLMLFNCLFNSLAWSRNA